MDTLAGDAPPEVAGLRELGTMLSEHVRLEERELFVLIEQALPAAALAAVATALQRADAAGDG